jgi:hypothetical protein
MLRLDKNILGYWKNAENKSDSRKYNISRKR